MFWQKTTILSVKLSFFLVANDIPKAPRNCYCKHTMRKVHRVIVCGNAVALAGIESSLGLDPNCEVMGLAMPVEPQELARLRPDVVIYALGTLQPELLYSLAKDLPNLLLIGIDLETNRAVLWFEQQAEGMSSQDLVQVIRQAKFKISISGREK
jgi:hypothetical protein